MNIALDSMPPFTAPSWALMGLEPVRAALEYAGMRMMDKTSLPRGDGHTVVLFPGLASDQHAVGPLKSFCSELGYDAHDWGRGMNTGPQGDPEVWLDELALHVGTLAKAGRGSISLVGWSLGGVYAREVAKRLKSRVRHVITVGTPIGAGSKHTHAGLVYRMLNGSDAVIDTAMNQRLRTAPDAPTTAIYSRSDGVVAWQACVQPGDGAHTENIEVAGSHCGLGWNAEVFAVLADRLSQTQGRWKRYATALPAGRRKVS